MDFRIRRNEDLDDEEETVSYNPPTIPDSAFSKPLLPSTSSLISGSSLGGVPNGIKSNPSPPDPSPPTETGGKTADSSPVRYRECLRNHAASLGGHILDGCGEFMPASAESIKCAACGCHRSFHRREGESLSDNPFSRSHRQHNGSRGGRIPLLLPPPPQQKHIQSFSSSPSAAGMVAFGNASGGGTTTESSSEERGVLHMPFVSQPPPPPSSKKRFRSKFSSEQKGRMMDFADRIGWRIQRQDEGEMEAFCAEVGVSRQVFKVWMHNNKHSVRRQQLQEQTQPQQQQQPLQEPQNL